MYRNRISRTNYRSADSHKKSSFPIIWYPWAGPKPLTSNKHRTQSTEDRDQLCDRHIRPVEQRFADLEKTFNENTTGKESVLTMIHSRLYQLIDSSQKLTEVKSSIEVISELQQALLTLTETVATLRRGSETYYEIKL